MAKRRTRTKLVYGSDAHYWPQPMKRLWIAVALIGVVADRRQAARQKLEEAAETYASPPLRTPHKQVIAGTHHTASRSGRRISGIQVLVSHRI